MVLSNKKLKQKLRATVTESIAAKESTAAIEDGRSHSNDNNKSLKELLGSATPKPRLSKREKRRKISSLNSVEPINGDAHAHAHAEEKNKETTTASEVLNEKKKKKNTKKKRKREDTEAQGTENGVSESKEGGTLAKKKKMKKKKKPNKKKTMKNNDDKEVEAVNAPEAKEQPLEINDSQEIADAATKVYVGGIPYYSTEDDIRSFFESCGTITEIDCMRFPETGKFRGIAMITFKTEAAAKRALALDGADMGGLFLKIQSYKTPRAPKSSDFAPEIIEGYNRVYVGNLSWDITEDELRKLFSDCKISAIRFGEDKTTGEFRGYAHVDLSNSLSLTIALKLDQTEVCGRPVRIRCAVPKKKVENKNSGPKAEKAENTTSVSSGGGGGKKRRTCYECGVPGHISSACPKKQVVEPVSSS